MTLTQPTVLSPVKPLPYSTLALVSLINEHKSKSNVNPTNAVSLQFDHSSATVEPSVLDSPVHGAVGIARYLARSFHTVGLYGSTPYEASLIDYWVNFSQERVNGTDFKALNSACQELNDHLKFRSFFVGYQLTLADALLWGALRSSNIWVKISKGKDAPVCLLRWYNHLASLPSFCPPKITKKSVADANAGDNKNTNSNAVADKKDQFNLHLDGAEQGKVVTRFPPEPSGYLHIGHIKAAMLNNYMAKQYGGKLIVRFDDTNPSKEKVEFEESILEDLKTLGIRGDALTWTSDSFDIIYKYALELIKKGKAYVDDTPLEDMRKERMDGIASKNRNLSVEENLRRFEEMKNGTEFVSFPVLCSASCNIKNQGLTCCLRAKMSIDAKNKALRDPVMYRCNQLPHNRTGRKWNIYPTYDFACPIVDSIEGVTHSLRTNEYHDRNDQYFWFIDALGLRKPHIWDYSRINFVYTLLSKRKLQWFVDQKLVSGWDDPRFPTVRGILRRGLTKEALKQFILMQGASKNTLLLEWDKLWAVNKQIIDPISPRFVALNKQDLCAVDLVDGPAQPHRKKILKHKKNPELGEKETLFSKRVYLDADDASGMVDGEEVTLMDWGNIIINKVHKNANGVVTSIEAKLHLEGDFKKTKKKLTWLAALDSELTPVQLVDYDFLITKKKLEEEDSVEDCINPKTEYITDAVGDANLKQLNKGDIIQLERRGFYICDRPLSATGPLKLIYIPDGKAASIALKHTSVPLGK